MGSYRFERVGQDGEGGGNALRADVEQALGELDWVEHVSLRGETEPGMVIADVSFDPDWPDTANADLVAEVFQRYGLHIIEDTSKAGGRVMAADPLRASASVGGDGLDLFVFDEE